MKSSKIGVILPAGGKSLRLETSLPKQFQKINQKPMFRFSLEIFHSCKEVLQVILVLPTDYIKDYEYLTKEFPKLTLVEGGKCRLHSVRFGFNALRDNIEQVLIHDVARPLITIEMIHNCINSFKKYSAFITGILSSDTVKEVEGKQIKKTLDRSCLLLVQTPQGFDYLLLKKCYEKLDTKQVDIFQFTDESSLVEFFGEKVYWIRGSSANRKITNIEDLKWLQN